MSVGYENMADWALRSSQKKWRLLRDAVAEQELFSTRFAFLTLLPGLFVYRPDEV